MDITENYLERKPEPGEPVQLPSPRLPPLAGEPAGPSGSVNYPNKEQQMAEQKQETPPRIWIDGSDNHRTWFIETEPHEGDIPYVPESELARVRREGWDDCMQQVCAAAKKLDIGGLNRTRVYTMLQNVARARDESGGRDEQGIDRTKL